MPDRVFQIAIVGIMDATWHEQRCQAFIAASFGIGRITGCCAIVKILNQLERKVVIREVNIADDLIIFAGA